MLTDIKCRTAKATDKAYKLPDTGGMYLYVSKAGNKSWRYNYRINGKQKTYTYGLYPEISLQEAREEHKVIHKMVSRGIDPHEFKERQKREAEKARSVLFKDMAEQWLVKRKSEVKQKTLSDIEKRLGKDVLPSIGHIPMVELDATDVLNMIKKVEARGAYEMANRARQYCSQILRYAIAIGKAKHDYTIEISDALAVHRVNHQPALEPDEIPEFLKALHENKARLYPRTQLALKMLMLTFVRPIELAAAEWKEFDFNDNRWIIPARKMKMGYDHVVPLAQQTLDILEQLKTMNGKRQYVFIKQTKRDDHMSRDTLSKAIRSLGFQDRHTAHGFRALARTAIREKLDYDSEVIERQLAHAPNTSLGRAYDRTKFLDQRTKMMQDWGDFLESEQL